MIDGLKARGRWLKFSNYRLINNLELFAVYLSVGSFKDMISGKHLKLHIDNSTAVACINHF